MIPIGGPAWTLRASLGAFAVIASRAGAAPSRFIAIDGKTLRQSFDAFADRKAAHVLSAFAVDHQIILAIVSGEVV